MMKLSKFLRRVLSLTLCMVLLCGLAVSAHAADFKYPNAYWPLQTAWVEALNNKDLDKMLTVAGQTYDMLRPLGLGPDVCANLEPKCGWAGLICEQKGDFAGAIMWLERNQEVSQWLNDNGKNFRDQLVGIENRLKMLRAASSPEIYALSEDAQSPYSVGPRQGTWYGSIVQGNRDNESAVLTYINFFDGYSVEYWLDYYKSTSTSFNAAATQGGVIELAWNFSPENTDSVRKVLDPSNDAYINDGLKALSQLNATILLRVGAEMNCWAADCDPDVFQQAFRKVATEAHKYGNIQTVFSPADVGSLNHSLTDYWPGDAYVDWVGMSSYHNNASFVSYDKSLPSTGGYERYQTYNQLNQDGYYSLGVYSTNPLNTVKEVMDLAAAHSKPVMISECGFGYRDKTTGADQTAFAASQLTIFYAYVNMVYPQVKAVFYFNDIGGGSRAYEYRLDQNATVCSAYETITKNGSYIAKGGSALNWVSLDKVGVKSANGKLTLATYAMLPGSATSSTSVSYFVDGKQVGAASTAPYLCELDLSTLSAGQHTVQAEATCTDGSMKATVKTTSYTLNVPGGAEPEKPAEMTFTDVPDYFVEAVSWAVEKKITNGYDAATFGSADNCNQAQILTFLWRAKGEPEPTAANPFAGLDTAQFYAKPAIWAYEQGLISGGSFDAAGACTRGNVAAYLWKLAGSPRTGAASEFTDVPAELADAVSWAAAQGITGGYGDGLFGTNDACTRGQIAALLYRAYK